MVEFWCIRFNCNLNSAFADSIHFDKHRYTRNLVAFEKKFSLIILCWGKGQKTYVPLSLYDIYLEMLFIVKSYVYQN